MATEPEGDVTVEDDDSGLLATGALVAEKYRIIKVLGQGGMGVVYKAEQVLMNRTMALKMMLEKHSGTSLDYRRFRREAQSASKLDHPHIVSIHDFGFDQGRAYLCMDYLEGKTLEDMLPEAPLTLQQFGHIFVQVCDALQHAHEKGIVHRDLKPSNIMVTKRHNDEMFVVVLDFGLVKVSKNTDELNKLTATNMLVGTPLYMSPEQCQGEDVAPSSDIYSLACMMFESLTQVPPLFGPSMLDIMAAHVMKDPLKFSEIAPDLVLPPALEHVIMQALSKKPEDRPKSMKEFGKAIRLALGPTGTGSSLAPSDIRAALNKDENRTGDISAGVDEFEDPIEKGDRVLNREELEDNDEILAHIASQSIVGETIDNNFKILEMIGKGGMSVVYKARSQMLNKIVAIKTMHAHLVSDLNSLHRFRQEAQAASQLDHPNVIRVYGFGVTTSLKPLPYIVMDYIAGVSLSELINQQDRMPVTDALKVFIQVASALGHAHNKGVVHRDLKPSNIMLVEKDNDPRFVKIVDFGIAKILPQEEGGPQHRLTQTGDVFGSPTYMSPEQCLGKPVDKRSDVYAIGCVMYEALSGKPPHEGTSVFELLHKHTTDIPSSIKIPGAEQALIDRLDTIIFRALEKDPEKRYQSMAELENDLLSLQQDLASGLKGGDLRMGLQRHRRSFLRLLQSNKKLAFASAVFLICAISGTAVMAKSTWFFETHEFADPSYIWTDYIPGRIKKTRDISEAERQRVLDLGKSVMRLGGSFNGSNSALQIKPLKEMAEYCANLGALEDEYTARRKIVRIMDEAGSNNSVDYAQECEALADVLVRQKNFDAALRYLEKAQKARGPGKGDFPRPAPLIDQAYLEYKLGQDYNAVNSLNKAFEVLEDSPSGALGDRSTNDFRLSTIAHAISGDIYRKAAEAEKRPELKQEKLANAARQYAVAEKFNSETKHSTKSSKPSKLGGQLYLQAAYVNIKLNHWGDACKEFDNAFPYMEEYLKSTPAEYHDRLNAYAYACWNNHDFIRAFKLREQAEKIGSEIRKIEGQSSNKLN